MQEIALHEAVHALVTKELSGLLVPVKEAANGVSSESLAVGAKVLGEMGASREALLDAHVVSLYSEFRAYAISEALSIVESGTDSLSDAQVVASARESALGIVREKYLSGSEDEPGLVEFLLANSDLVPEHYAGSSELRARTYAEDLLQSVTEAEVVLPGTGQRIQRPEYGP